MNIILLLIASFGLSASTAPSLIEGNSLISGKPVSVAKNFTNEKALVLIFMSAKCPCSDSHMEEINQLAKNKSFQFVIINSNIDEDESSARTYFTAKTDLQIIRDSDQKIANQFKALKTPHVFVLSPQGEILYQGGVSNSAKIQNATRHYLKDALTSIANNSVVQEKETRTLGCVIQRKEEKNVW